MSLNPEDYFEIGDEFETTGRAPKLHRRKHPRDREFSISNKKEQERKAREKNEAVVAKKIIVKHLSHFPSPDTFEGERQSKTYIRWLRDSLEQGYPILSEGDVQNDYYVASVHAGGQNRQKNETAVRSRHTPTLMIATNSDERDRELNEKRAYESLYPRLETHLTLWRDYLKPEGGNTGLIENKVIEILQKINAEKQKR